MSDTSEVRQLGAWQALRAIRNRFAHDCPENDALKAAYLNEVVASVPLLLALLAGIAPLVGSLQRT